jgi:hypothetical protein
MYSMCHKVGVVRQGFKLVSLVQAKMSGSPHWQAVDRLSCTSCMFSESELESQVRAVAHGWSFEPEVEVGAWASIL